MTTELRVLDVRPNGTAGTEVGARLRWCAGDSGGARAVRITDRDERSIGVWDGDDVRRDGGAFSFGLTVPGGAMVPAAGVTMVSVAATHRRRGVLTSMMRRQLDDVRSWGEPLAVLTASEPEIYGRFGYGIATQHASREIDTVRVRIDRARRARTTSGCGSPDVRRMAPRACEAVYARRSPRRPGMLGAAAGLGAAAAARPAGRAGGRIADAVRGRRAGRARSSGTCATAIKPEWDAAGPERHGHGAAHRGARPGGVRGAVALPLRHRPDVDGDGAQPAGGRSAAAPRQRRPALRGAAAGLAATYGWWTWGRRWRRGRTRRRWTWCSRSRTPSARGTRDAGG